MTEKRDITPIKDLIDEIDKERFHPTKAAAIDHRTFGEKRTIPHPRYKTIRDGIQLIDSVPMTNPSKYVIELANYLRARDKGVETMAVMLLNEQNMNLGIETVGTGTVKGISIYPRQIFDIAFHPQYRASGIILAHNHPSGDPRPSPEDLDQMRQIKMLGDHLDCKLKDFIVLGVIDYFSAKNETYEL